MYCHKFCYKKPIKKFADMLQKVDDQHITKTIHSKARWAKKILQVICV